MDEVGGTPGGGSGSGFTNIDALPNGKLLQTSFGGSKKKSKLSKLRNRMPSKKKESHGKY